MSAIAFLAVVPHRRSTTRWVDRRRRGPSLAAHRTARGLAFRGGGSTFEETPSILNNTRGYATITVVRVREGGCKRNQASCLAPASRPTVADPCPRDSGVEGITGRQKTPSLLLERRSTVNFPLAGANPFPTRRRDCGCLLGTTPLNAPKQRRTQTNNQRSERLTQQHLAALP